MLNEKRNNKTKQSGSENKLKGDSDNKIFAYISESGKKGNLEAKNMEEAGDILEGKKIKIKAIAEKSEGERKSDVYIPCSQCKKMRSISSYACPHCGSKKDGFNNPYIMGGGITGIMASVIFVAITTGAEDIGGSLICGACFLNPLLWAFVLGGGIIGLIIGELKKNKLKRQL